MAQGLWSSEINIAAKRKPLRLGEDIGQMRKYSTLDHYWGRRIKREGSSRNQTNLPKRWQSRRPLAPWYNHVRLEAQSLVLFWILRDLASGN
ncbi:hypothetical protein PCANC_01342 [Puccinia coronata f. sp. avenae]|uniref:Uncharacterized protein n=1 Tax=Puccinia coronata f. sp. avenae TaxID=200324 RepID=A0A2N5W698_9BASI|nr:hypothetical protein PCANC_01342 [Puccinia coronata f. sp. avenae]